jgi:hypothetical protein
MRPPAWFTTWGGWESKDAMNYAWERFTPFVLPCFTTMTFFQRYSEFLVL